MYNLYTLKNDQPQALTNFNTSIKQPQVDAKGDKIVLRKITRFIFMTYQRVKAM